MPNINVSIMLKKTRDKKWVLPNFQREFVWTANQIAELLDSMAHGYPIGAIILLKYQKEYFFQARGLDGEEDAGYKHEFYIIDGQQRMTSLYKIIQKYSSKFITIDNPELYKCPIRDQNYEFFFKYDANQSKDQYVYAPRQLNKARSEEWMKGKGYIPLGYVFCKGQTLNSYLKKHKIKSYKKKITEFKNKILNYNLTITQCENNWKTDEYRTVFTRLNKAGTNLSAFDECASILNDHKFNLHEQWKKVSKSGGIKTFDIDPMYILKTMFIINEINNNKSNIRTPSLRNLKKIYLKDINTSEIKSTWDDSVEYVNKACKRFADNYGVLNKRLIPYTPMIVTLASTLYSFEKYKGYAKYLKRFHNKIDWWYWSSVFSSQYDKSTDNKIEIHVNKLIKWTHPTKSKDSKWNGHRIDPKDFRQALERMHINSDARYKGIICLPFKGLKSKDDILIQKIIDEFDDHHIFPKGRLEKLELGLSVEQINNVANRIALHPNSNRMIKDLFPFEYKNQKEPISVSNKKWKSFFIPQLANNFGEVTKHKYLSFLRDRTGLIIDEIQKLIKKP